MPCCDSSACCQRGVAAFFPVGGKFFLAVGVLLLAVLGVAVAAEVSLTQTKRQADQLFSDHLRTTQRTADLVNVLDDVKKAALR